MTDIQKTITKAIEDSYKKHIGRELGEIAPWVAEAVDKALKDKGLCILPREPTKGMLTNVGTMEGFEVDNEEPDRLHIEWWQAMIEAWESGDE